MSGTSEQKHLKNNIPLGALFIFLAALCYACMGAVVKFSRDYSTDAQLVFIRNAVCLVLLLPWILLPKPKPLKSPVFHVHLIRAAAGLLNMYCFFYSIRFILLSDAMLLNNTMPLFIPLIMFLWKKEKIPVALVPGLVLGFLGVLLILRPGTDIFQPAAFFALASGFFMSISMAGIRELGFTEPLYRILFYYFSISTVISAIPLFWSWKSQSLLLWGALISIGIFAAAYQYLLTKGYEKAPASRISPIIYVAVVISGLFDWIFWNQIPATLSYFGVVLVFIGAYICIRVEG